MNFPIALAKFTKYCCVFTKSLVRSEAVMLSYLKYPFYDLPFKKKGMPSTTAPIRKAPYLASIPSNVSISSCSLAM